MANTPTPITNANIDIYRAEDYGITGPIATADIKEDDPGYYIAEELDEGDYTYKVSAPTKGSKVGDFTLPGPGMGPNKLKKILPPITLVSAAEVNVTLYNKDGQVIVIPGAGGATGPTGVTGVTGDLDIQVSRIIAEGGGEGVYTVPDAPVGQRLIEVKPANIDEYQNLKIIRTISKPTTDVTIILNPPITLYVTVTKTVGGIISPAPIPDTTCRLFEVSSTGGIIREFTAKVGNAFKVTHLADSTIYIRAYAPSSNIGDGSTEPLNPLTNVVSISLAYSDSVSGAINRTINYNI